MNGRNLGGIEGMSGMDEMSRFRNVVVVIQFYKCLQLPLYNLAKPNIHHIISISFPKPQTLTPPSPTPPRAQPRPSPWPTNPPTTDLAALPLPALTPSDFSYISSRCRGTSQRGRSCPGGRRGLRGGIGCRRWGAIYELCL